MEDYNPPMFTEPYSPYGDRVYRGVFRRQATRRGAFQWGEKTYQLKLILTLEYETHAAGVIKTCLHSLKSFYCTPMSNDRSSKRLQNLTPAQKELWHQIKKLPPKSPIRGKSRTVHALARKGLIFIDDTQLIPPKRATKILNKTGPYYLHIVTAKEPGPDYTELVKILKAIWGANYEQNLHKTLKMLRS